jgi:primosomal protein N' (replication factor Y) (superfamily II helicase)
MSSPFCNVALPVPLRTTFTYAVPEPLRGMLQPGTRVLVPFRKKSMVGVVVDLAAQPPANTKIREIIKVMEFRPALTPKLIELAEWIANYYLAPVGEVFRAMLPPLTELNVRREILLTLEGRRAAESLGGGELSHGLTSAEAEFLAKAGAKKGPVLFRFALKTGVSAAALERLQRFRLIEIRETLRDTKRKS